MPFRVMGRWFLVLLLPMLELLALTYLPSPQSSPWNIRVRALDVLLPLPTAFFLLMFLLERAEKLTLKFDARILAGNLALAGLALVWPNTLLVVLSALTAFCVWVPARYYLKNPNRVALIPCALLALSVAFYTGMPDALWSPIAKTYSEIVAGGVATLSAGTVEKSVTTDGAWQVGKNAFKATVGRRCWGLDGFFYFMVLFLLLTALFRKGLSIGRWFSSFFVGFVVVFALNLLRVLILVWLGSWAYETMGNLEGARFVRNLVHPHIGWILYTPALFLYFRFWLKWSWTEEKSGPFFWNFLLNRA